LKLFGQIDLKPVLVTVLSGAILSAGGYVYSKIVKVDLLEARLARIEDSQEQILLRLPPLVPAPTLVPAKGTRR